MKNYCLNRILFVFALFVAFKTSNAIDLRSYFEGNTSPYLTYESNYSSILNRQVQFSGYGLGLEWESGVALGLTYFHLGSNVITPKFSPLGGADWQMKIRYVSFMLAYTLYDKSKFLVIAEIGNGFGNINMLDKNIQKNKYGLYCFEPTLHARYYVLEWLGLATQLGYRLAIPGGAPTVGDISSFKFDIGFTIAPLAFYKALKNNTLVN